MATISTTATIQPNPQQACPKSETGGMTACDATAGTPCKEDVGWRKIVRNFTPSWFAVTMGTGIVSILLHNLPYNTTWISHGLAVAFFVLNVGLFAVFTGITVLRYALYPEIWKAMVIHPAQSMFLGCFPMGFATIINMMIFVCAPDWGNWVVSWAWGFWWLDAALSLATCITVPFVILPPKEAIVSVFLPIGPLGQGGFGIQQLGKVSLKLLPQTTAFTSTTPGAVQGGEILYFLGIFLALIMWGFALVWLSFALISIVTMQKFPFNMGWWGFTFPLGVMATCTGMLAQDLDSIFFRVMTMVCTVS
ncbi:major facilitator family transporter [Colletotrichum camelliae]|nr:major facilitator family transporter [Colletotrichum camelliae]